MEVVPPTQKDSVVVFVIPAINAGAIVKVAAVEFAVVHVPLCTTAR